MPKKVVCFGEVLWDVLPTGKVAGGAPMNVSIRLQSLGISTQIISRVGNDVLGKELELFLKKQQVSTSLVQTDHNLATGEVLVQLDAKGSATYDIVYPSAWDKIGLNCYNKQAVRDCDAFVFGSLACRDEVSSTTLLSLLELAPYKVFDVNLRPPFYSISYIKEMMQLADFIKMNEEELLEIAQALGSASNMIESNIIYLSRITNTATFCVTRGRDGAVLYHDQQFHTHPGFSVQVEDTIGSGDSFLAALLSRFLTTTDLFEAVRFACAVGALVATHKGANPELQLDEINTFIAQHNLGY
jgi:fructokinase